MIPEEARLEIVRKKNLGETWTAIAKWMEQEFGESVHRTTVQRWYDKEVSLERVNPDDIVLGENEYFYFINYFGIKIPMIRGCNMTTPHNCAHW